MHVPPRFQFDRTASLAFAGARGFGLVCAHDGRRPVSSPLPFCLDYAADGTPLASFHVARNNPLAGLAGGRGDWLLAVTGADAYVSADWYASPDQVPTWLYEAVHLSGPVTMMSEDGLSAHVDALSAIFEERLAPKPPWRSAKMTAGRLVAMKKGIVGLVMRVEQVEGSLKLNQHKSDADHAAVADALGIQADPGARSLARRMVALRPHLDYKSVPPSGGATNAATDAAIEAGITP
ncbi:MAG: FMN-binding negative transcriptional regulator [Xanthobacteraceae bacterium]|nr:FMN-binding negative transcriptional regulator [Xanthobacteraceae bacterium]